MSEMSILGTKESLTVDSREVAEWTGKRHDHLLRDIQGYCEILTTAPNLGVSDFFVESEYQDSTGRTLPCYLLTKKGCDMVANKMTGEKGVKFSATYINRFYEMEQFLTAPKALSPLEQLQLQVQVMQELQQGQKEQKAAIEAVNQRVDTIGEILTLNPSAWREDARNMIVRIAHAWGGNEYISNVHTEIYSLIDTRFGVNLKRRRDNKRAKAAVEGANKTQIAKISKLEVIADDKKLIEAYLTIIKEMAIKHGVDKAA